jgi:hypothetical protein
MLSPQAKKCQESPEVGRGKKMNSPLKFLEELWSCQYLEISVLIQIWTSDLQNLAK